VTREGLLPLGAVLGIAVFACIGNVLAQVGIALPPFAWSALLAVAIPGAIAALSFATRQVAQPTAVPNAPSQTGAAEGRRWHERALGLVPYLVFVPGVVAVLRSVRQQISFHGFVHVGYVLEILHGHVPPENVTFPGTPANFYWLFHALLAAISTVTQQPPTLVATQVNVVVLICSLGLATALIGLLAGRERSPVTMSSLAVAAVFSGNLLGSAWAILHNVKIGKELSFWHLKPSMIVGDSRLESLFSKFLNFNGFPVGVACFLAVLLIVVAQVRRGPTMAGVLTSVIVTSAALTLHTTTGLFNILVVPPALAAAVLATRARDGGTRRAGERTPRRGKDVKRHSRPAWQGSLAVVMVVGLAVVPALAFVWRASSAMPGGARIAILNRQGLQSLAIAILPLGPFLLLALARARRERDAATLFVGLVAVIGMALAANVRLAGGNDYKFVFLSGIAAGVASAVTAARFLNSRSLRARVVGWSLVGLALANATLVGVARAGEPVDTPFRYEGVHLVAPGLHPAAARGDLHFSDLYEWLRDSTPTDTIVVVPMMGRNDAAVYVLAERLPFLVDGNEFNSTLPEFKERRRLLRTFYTASSTPTKRKQALSAIRATLPGRPMFIVVPDDLVPRLDLSRLGLVTVRTGHAAALLGFSASDPQSLSTDPVPARPAPPPDPG
jgi:hypothetical protein